MAYLMKTTFFKINSNASELIFTLVTMSVKTKFQILHFGHTRKKIKQPKSKMGTLH